MKWGKYVTGAVTLAAIACVLQWSPPSASAETASITLAPQADAYVQGGSASGNNYGTNPSIALRGDRYRDGYLRFDLSALHGTVTSAKLLLTGGAPVPAVSIQTVAEDGWSETALTYSNRPAGSGTVIAGVRPDTSGPVEFDLGTLVRAEQQGDKQLSLVLFSTLGTSAGTNFDSRETVSGTAPRLVVELDPTQTLIPEADAYVQGGSAAANNYGGSEILALRGDRYRDAYLRFNLGGFPYAVQRAGLQLTGGFTPPATNADFVSQDDWGELSLTHANRPSSVNAPVSGERTGPAGPVVFDVTQAAKTESLGDNKLSLLLYSTLGAATSYNFHSKESTTGTPPQLIVEPVVQAVTLQAEEVASVQSGSRATDTFPDTIMTRVSNKHAYLRYDLSGLEGIVTGAKLRLAGTSDMLKAFAVSGDNWSKDTLTYSNAPVSGREIAVGQYGPAGYVDLDVTSQVQYEHSFDQHFSVKLSSTIADEITYVYGSRPELVLTMLYRPRLSSVTLEPKIPFGNSTASIPLQGEMKQEFQAFALDQNGGVMQDEPIIWSVDGSPAGVAVDAAGVLSVSNAASAGPVVLRAAAAGDSAVAETASVTLLASVPNARTHPYALYHASDLAALRSKAQSAPYQPWYTAVKATADKWTQSQLDDIPQMNPWRTFTFTFQAPPEAVSVKLSYRLYGKGSIRLDNAALIEIGQEDVSVPNAGFESGSIWPDGWSRTVWSGSPVFEWAMNGIMEQGSTGLRSARISNGDSGDRGGWTTAGGLPVAAGSMYSAQVDVSQVELLEEGFYVIAEFQDGAGQDLGAPLRSLRFNRLTMTPRAGLGLAEQAVAYAVEDNALYAEKAKKTLDYTLRDMREMMVGYLSTGNDPDQTSQAVHIGRGLGNAAIAYDMIRSSGVISTEEDNELRSLFYWIADQLLNQSYYDYSDDTAARSNYNSDRAAGLGIFAVIFPEYASSSTYLNHAVSQIQWQLAHVAGADGGWPETIRYHQAVMDRWIPFAKMLKRTGGTDLFQNGKFKQMFRFLIETQTPRDAVHTLAPGKAAYPAIGDHTWREAVHILGMGAPEYTAADPLLSKQMMYAWNRSGSVLKAYYSVMTLISFDPSLPEQSPALSSRAFDDMGYIIFRQDYDQPGEDYMAIVGGSPQLKSHQHEDRGSFSLYADNTPLSLDPGVSAYGIGVNPNWYQTSKPHNTVQFKNSSGVYADGPVTSVVEATYFSSELDYLRISIPDNLADRYIRHIAYVRKPYDAYVIWDDIASARPSAIRYHTLSTSTEVSGPVAVAHGYNNKDLEISWLRPANPVIMQSTGALADGYPQNFQEMLTVEGAANGDYLTVLYPKTSGAGGLSTTTLEVGQPQAHAYKVMKPDGSWFVILLNRGAVSLTVQVPVSADLTDLRTGTVYGTSAGGTAVHIGPGEMAVMQP
ncbi:MAG: hypothetical protein K0R57_370 [Paenibacillaceae bacterium]|jgi:hypothetical protein|nr:hypothetical protein [Paenibacillaceae bacterium]